MATPQFGCGYGVAAVSTIVDAIFDIDAEQRSSRALGSYGPLKTGPLKTKLFGLSFVKTWCCENLKFKLALSATLE